MEYGGDGPAKTAFRFYSVKKIKSALRAKGAPALRAGQVVPGRAAAALVALVLLAQGWPAGLGQPGPLRRRERQLRRGRSAGGAVPSPAPGASWAPTPAPFL